MLQTIQNLYEQFMTEVVSQPWFYPLLTAVGVCLLFFFFFGLRRHRGLRVYRDESGNASVSKKALKDLVHIACASIDTATKPRIQVKPHRGRLDMTIRVKLYEGQRLNELRDKLRRSVIRTFEESHGIRLGDINVLVVGFKKGAAYDTSAHSEDVGEKAPEPTNPAALTPTESSVRPHETVYPKGGATDQPSWINDDADNEDTKGENEALTSPDEEDMPKKRSLFSWGKKADVAEPDKDTLLDPSTQPEEKPEGEGLLGNEKK